MDTPYILVGRCSAPTKSLLVQVVDHLFVPKSLHHQQFWTSLQRFRNVINNDVCLCNNNYHAIVKRLRTAWYNFTVTSLLVNKAVYLPDLWWRCTHHLFPEVRNHSVVQNESNALLVVILVIWCRLAYVSWQQNMPFSIQKAARRYSISYNWLVAMDNFYGYGLVVTQYVFSDYIPWSILCV